MDENRCPHCQIVFTETERSVGACPVCHERLDGAERNMNEKTIDFTDCRHCLACGWPNLVEAKRCTKCGYESLGEPTSVKTSFRLEIALVLIFAAQLGRRAVEDKA